MTFKISVPMTIIGGGLIVWQALTCIPTDCGLCSVNLVVGTGMVLSAIGLAGIMAKVYFGVN